MKTLLAFLLIGCGTTFACDGFQRSRSAVRFRQRAPRVQRQVIIQRQRAPRVHREVIIQRQAVGYGYFQEQVGDCLIY